MVNQTNTHINYPKLVDQAMRDIAKKVLSDLASHGVHGNHYFMVSFLSSDKNVKLTQRLKERYPNEMTIILQHQFENLIVTDQKIVVQLSFDGIKEMVEIPFDALTSFIDPSANFALQFNPELLDKKERTNIINMTGQTASSKAENTKNKESKILVLDNFRKT